MSQQLVLIMTMSHVTQEYQIWVQMVKMKSTTRDTDMKALVTAQKDKLDFHLMIQYSIPRHRYIWNRLHLQLNVVQ